MNFDRTKTLQELENEDWGEPKHTTGLVIACHQLRHKPLRDFTSGDLRLMIGQEIGLDYLVPLALEVLSDNPLLEGTFYRGDLLLAVLRIQTNFWQDNPDLWWQVAELVTEVECIRETLETAFPSAIQNFQAARKE